MRIRLTYASEDELRRYCRQPLELGVLFLPMERLPPIGTFCSVQWHVLGGPPLLLATGSVAGVSALEDEAGRHQGPWIRLLEFLLVEPRIGAWLETLGAADALAGAAASERRPAGAPEAAAEVGGSRLRLPTSEAVGGTNLLERLRRSTRSPA